MFFNGIPFDPPLAKITANTFGILPIIIYKINMLNKSLSYKSLIIKWCKDMYPFNRSLTGKGVDKTLGYLKSINKI